MKDKKLPEEKLGDFIAKMPIVSVDLITKYKGGVLLCKRNNEPAKNRWFPPGGRFLKGESPKEVIKRIASKEIGIKKVKIGELLGAYSHFYETVRFPPAKSTHYIALGFQVSIPKDSNIILDEQHGKYKIFYEIKPSFHPYVKEYLEEAEVL